MLQEPKYERVAVVCKAQGDYKVLAFLSGNSKAELIRKMKSNLYVRNNGFVWFDGAEDLGLPTKAFNSNRF
jgi:hypothetical protein